VPNRAGQTSFAAIYKKITRNLPFFPNFFRVHRYPTALLRMRAVDILSARTARGIDATPILAYGRAQQRGEKK
jgi:hypothetical protein